MKKVILLLSIIGAALFMTSCLGEESNNFTDHGFVYVDMDARGTPYGKSVNPEYYNTRFITTSKMMGMTDGTIKYMMFNWDEEYGYTPVVLDGQTTIDAYNVQLLSDPVDVATTYLNISELGEIEDPLGFDEIRVPIYSDDAKFMGDYWIIQYAYTAKKGQKPDVKFYKREEPNEKGEIVIDINLTLTGTPETQTTQMFGDAVAVNMSQLRHLDGGTSNKELKIIFKYYKNQGDNTKPKQTDSNTYSWKISAE